MVRVANTKTYNPTKPDEIVLCMADMQEYIKRKDTIDPLIKAALLHYQIEAIHPFESGNGRIGRIIIAQYLYETGLLKYTLLPISELLLMDKVEYFDRLNAVHYWGRYEQWIKFFLKTLETVADKTLRSVETVLRLRATHISIIKNEKKDVTYLLNAYDQAEKNIFLNTAALAKLIGVSYNTGARIMDKLVSMGIMKQFKPQARNRIFYYSDFLDAVDIKIHAVYNN
jgi:Fic family protein